ncbi:response regulator transcription factor [Streptomyces sp. ISL-99]|uniref:response regulator n=1 Tax=Streptomyces sp. ISL-99 TaxID=2819193 RepID=UPI001BE62FE0|nr:response regulator transcription factor [Streptomyces sp. ISL-99]MBT2524301.1 response regulator transcription factor [Streptomyces sp. ISL-99]
MPVDGKIIVFLVDDHEVVRRGVHELLSVEDDIEVVGEAGTATDALVRIPATRPDVAVLDVRLPDGSGVEVCREVRSQNADIKCLMLTSFADDEALFDAIMAGASGYVLKAIRGNELLVAVRDVAAGKSLLDPVATARVLERLRSGNGDGSGGDGAKGDSRLANLTEQERKILDLIGEGLTNRVIGERLHLAEKTIKNYVSSLLSKLGMQRRSQAAAYVARKQAEERR